MDPQNRLDAELVGPPPVRPSSNLKPAAAICTFALILVVLMWAAVWSFLHNEYTAHIEAQKRQNENLVRVFEAQTAAMLAAADQALVRTKQRVESRRRDLDLDQLAAESGLAPATLTQLAIVNRSGVTIDVNALTSRDAGANANGALRHGGAATPAGAGAKARVEDDSDRDYFRAQAGRDSGQMFIGAQARGRSGGRFVLPLSRRLNAADGSFDGVVVASIDPAWFARSYDRAELGQDGMVVLTALDGSIRAAGAGGPDLTRPGPVALQFPHLSGAADLASSGSYMAADEVQRLYSYRKLADYPLIIAVGTSVHEILGNYDSDRRVYLAFAGVFSAVALIAALSLVFSFDRLLGAVAVLRASEAKAHNDDRAKSQFITGISMELRTPLAGMRGFSELLEKRLEQPGLREQAGIIRRAAERLDAVLGDVLDMTSIEAGALEIVRRSTDIRALATEAVERLRPAAEARGLAFTLAADVDVPARAAWDARLVQKILGHLLSHSIEQTESGEITLHVARHGDRIVLGVAGTGVSGPLRNNEPAITSPDQVSSDPGEPQLSWDEAGADLGLALSRAYVQLMEGELTVAPAAGTGVRFTLTLPIGEVGETRERRPLALAA
jgi:signal transduction histidine kinase